MKPIDWILFTEFHHRGWITARSPGARHIAQVKIDGKLARHVLAVNRNKGKAVVHRFPYKKDKRGKRLLTKTVRGVIELLAR